MNNRIKYEVGEIYINNKTPTQTRIVSLTTNFELSICFCSCSVKYSDKYEYHYENCPNTKNQKRVGYVDCKGKEIFDV